MPGARPRDDGADAKLNDVLYSALCSYPEQWYDAPAYVERRTCGGEMTHLLHIGNDEYAIARAQMHDLRKAVAKMQDPDAGRVRAAALEILNRD